MYIASVRLTHMYIASVRLTHTWFTTARLTHILHYGCEAHSHLKWG